MAEGPTNSTSAEAEKGNFPCAAIRRPRADRSLSFGRAAGAMQNAA